MEQIDFEIIIIKFISQMKILLTIIALLAALGLAIRLEVDSELQTYFSQWVQVYGKQYQNLQIKRYRMNIFLRNWEKVLLHNDRYYDGDQTWLMQLNQNADLTQQQYVQQNRNIPEIISYNHSFIQNLYLTLKCDGIVLDAPNPPVDIDWSQKYVTKPSDEKDYCGAGWAMSAVGAIQSLYSIKKNKIPPPNFSIHQAIQCSGDYGNQRCNGGYYDQAYWYFIDYGIASNDIYKPVDKKCVYSKTMNYTSFKVCAKVPMGNYSKLVSAVVQQPTTVAIDSSGLQLYGEGVFTSSCGTNLDRALLLVGYGNDNGTLYWKLRENKGPNWGQNGYFRLQKTTQDGPGKCGIQLLGSVPQQIS